MTSQTPTWTEFQPDLAPALPSEGGHVVAVVSLPGARDGGADLAVDLARAWFRAGLRVVLADLDLVSPRLHELLGVENRDGISDAVAFGASVGRVARAVEGEGFFFIGAGTAVAEPGSFLEHPRWEALCQGFQEAGATLVAYVPGDVETRAHVLDHATDVVLLGAAEDDPGALGADLGDRVRAFLGPSTGSEEEIVSLASLAPDDEVAAEEETSDSTGDDFGLVEAEEPEDVPAPMEEEDTTGEDDFSLSDEEDTTGEDDFALSDEEDTTGEDDFALSDEEDTTAEDDFALSDEEVTAGDDDFALSDDEATTEDHVASENPFALTEDEVEEEVPSAEGPEEGEVPGEPGFDPEPELTSEPEPDFSLEPEEEPEESGPEAPREFADEEEMASSDLGAAEVGGGDMEEEHPRVPLADEILAEAGDAPEAAVQMGEGPGPGAPASVGRGEPETGGRRTFLLVLLLVVVAGAALAWWLGYVEIPGIASPASTSTTQPARSVAPLVAAEPLVETAPSAAWAVQLEAHQDRETAWERAGAFAAQVPEHLWTTVPVEVDGTVFHRVVVGGVPQEAMAEALRGQVAEELDADPAGWVLRATPFAYRLGETDALAQARERVASFRDQGIPAYALAVTWSDGSERFRIYAGAFADEAEARGMGALLAERGLTEHELTERTGRLPE